MSWEPINPAKPKDTELIGDDPFDNYRLRKLSGYEAYDFEKWLNI